MNATQGIAALRAAADALDAEHPRDPRYPTEMTIQNAMAAAAREIADRAEERAAKGAAAA